MKEGFSDILVVCFGGDFHFQINTNPVGWDNAIEIYGKMNSIYFSSNIMFIERIMYHISLHYCEGRRLEESKLFRARHIAQW